MRDRLWPAIAIALVLANAAVASGHDWWYWMWGRTDMRVFIATRYASEAEAARRDWSYPHTHLSLARDARHADISLIDGDYGLTQWSGLATVESWGRSWPWLCGGAPACRFVHAHARYNSASGGRAGADARSDVRGIFCQELGHTLGLAHSNAGDCMGKRYFRGNDANVAGPHAWADVDARY